MLREGLCPVIVSSSAMCFSACYVYIALFWQYSELFIYCFDVDGYRVKKVCSLVKRLLCSAIVSALLRTLQIYFLVFANILGILFTV